MTIAMVIPLVTLTTDFGRQSEGPGIMEATIYGIAPYARVVHLTHEVNPFSVIDGARQMECVTTIPKGIHVCVVDPGVGGERRGVVAVVEKIGLLVGPDNGVLLSAARMTGGIRRIFCISNPHILRQPISTTFHGRDIFASVAGHLASGLRIEEVGEEISSDTLVVAPYDDAIINNGIIDCMVIHINRFGNCILNIREELLFDVWNKSSLYVLKIEGKSAGAVKRAVTFSNVVEGDLMLCPDSYGRVVLAINLGDAARSLGLSIGTKVGLRL